MQDFNNDIFYLDRDFLKESNKSEHDKYEETLIENIKLKAQLNMLEKWKDYSQSLMEDLKDDKFEYEFKYNRLLDEFNSFKEGNTELKDSENKGFIWPVDLKALNATALTDQYKKRLPLEKQIDYSGIDINAFPYSPVVAVEKGRVEAVFKDDYECYRIIVRHDIKDKTIKSDYQILSEVTVKKGERIKKGQKLGYIGCKDHDQDYHLHFEMYEDGQKIDVFKYIPLRKRLEFGKTYI